MCKTVVNPKELFLNENKFPRTTEKLAVTQTFAHCVLMVPKVLPCKIAFQQWTQVLEKTQHSKFVVLFGNYLL